MQQALRTLSARLLLALLRLYRLAISPILRALGAECRFEPSCSNYASESIRRFGALSGMKLSVMRLLRCHPFCPGGYDPVPGERASARVSPANHG